ncbi:hypothetical protein Q4577_17250 [Marinovum sp. 2_MG-2023]|nr:hypothetical protein [Marinovum sp. 2_MG-2023]MDO6781035.1 hypothetical protein [Marinovum sp. 1_MG-2023]
MIWVMNASHVGVAQVYDMRGWGQRVNSRGCNGMHRPAFGDQLHSACHMARSSAAVQVQRGVGSADREDHHAAIARGHAQVRIALKGKDPGPVVSLTVVGVEGPGIAYFRKRRRVYRA